MSGSIISIQSRMIVAKTWFGSRMRGWIHTSSPCCILFTRGRNPCFNAYSIWAISLSLKLLLIKNLYTSISRSFKTLINLFQVKNLFLNFSFSFVFKVFSYVLQLVPILLDLANLIFFLKTHFLQFPLLLLLSLASSSTSISICSSSVFITSTFAS